MATQREEAASRLEWQQRHTQALRSTAESIQIGRATTHTLSMQAEQLGHSERMLDETQATVAMSQRLLRGMSWSGWLYNKVSALPQHGTQKRAHEIAMGFICPECRVNFESPEQLGMHYDRIHDDQQDTHANHGTERPNASRDVPAPRQVAETTNTIDEIHDNFLRELAPQVAELKDMSLALGGALDMQTAHLARLDSKIGRVHHDLKLVGIQANKRAGTKISVVFCFRCALQEVQTGSADVVVDGCAFRAYTLGDDNDVWGFQSEKSSCFLGINRYGNLKVQGAAMKSYEQFLIEGKPSTPIFSLSSYFGTGGWIAMKGAVGDNHNLTIIRGSPENKSSAAYFKIVNLEDGIKTSRKD